MHPAAAALIIGLVVFDLFIAVFICVYAVRSCWSPIAAKFPPREPAPDAIHREFQSFSAGFLNLGWSIHVAVDADFLHLRPTYFARLIRIKPTSIPWSAITLDRYGSGRRILRATIAGHDLRGPRWCLELANPPDANLSR